MADLVDRHELRLALEREEVIAKQLLGKNEPLATAFFDIVYRTLNKMSFPKSDTDSQYNEVVRENGVLKWQQENALARIKSLETELGR